MHKYKKKKKKKKKHPQIKKKNIQSHKMFNQS